MKLRDGGTIFMLIVLFVGFIFAENAEAGEWQVMLASHHFGDSVVDYQKQHTARAGYDPSLSSYSAKEYNAFNPGLIYSHHGLHAGAFRNSEYSLSLIAGVDRRIGNSLSASISIATGYDYAPLMPMIGLHYTNNHARLSVTPYIGKNKAFKLAITDPETGGYMRVEKIGNESFTSGVAVALSLVF